MEKDAPKGSIVGTLITVALVLCAVLLIYRFANWPLLLSLDFGVLWQYRGVLMSGLGTTFLITAVSGVVGLGVGTVLAVASQSHFWPLRWAIVRLRRNMAEHPIAGAGRLDPFRPASRHRI